MYDCHAGRCGKIEDWKCERRCADIESPGKNVIIMSGGYLLVMARSSGILKAKQKLGRTFNSDKLK